MQSLNRETKEVFKEPGTVLEYYGKDQPHSTGIDPFAFGLNPTHTWDKIEYRFNSLGLRGPEPNYNAKHRILIAGGSFCIGVGVGIEQTFASKLCSKLGDSSYINLSDYDTFTEMYDDLKIYIDKFKPTMIVLGDSRFVDEYGFTWRKLWLDHRDTKFVKDIRKVLQKRNKKIVEMMVYYFQHKYNIPTHLVYAKRKDFKFDIDDGLVIDPLDLARDGRHPGPDSHENIANELYELYLDR